MKPCSLGKGAGQKGSYSPASIQKLSTSRAAPQHASEPAQTVSICTDTLSIASLTFHSASSLSCLLRVQLLSLMLASALDRVACMEPVRTCLSQLMLSCSLRQTWVLQPAHTFTAFAFFGCFLVLNIPTFLPFNLDLCTQGFISTKLQHRNPVTLIQFYKSLQRNHMNSLTE